MKAIKFSIIVPVFHESARINDLIDHLSRLVCIHEAEIIVVDGSPEMDTIKAIRNEHVTTISSVRGRAKQMNAGASTAKGEILIFLHADTELPQDGLIKISSSMAQPRYVGGAFELDIDSQRLMLKLIARFASLRCRLTRIPYGDQAIFVRKDYFETLGAYQDIPLMEDVELMRRVKKRGDTIHIIRDRVLTSARRWEEEGLIYVFLRNQALFTLYLLGVSPERLACFYPDRRKQRL